MLKQLGLFLRRKARAASVAAKDWCLLSVLQLPLVCDIAGSAAHSVHQNL
jgi:hypothetical protein